MITESTVLFESTSALAVLEDSSRFLLTLGVGLFLAYVVLIVGANLIGFAHHRVSKASRDKRTTTLSRSQPAQRPTVQVREVPRAVVMERKAL